MTEAVDASVLAPFGRRLKMARRLARLDQGELAEKIGKSRSSIANMEAGRQNPPLTELVKLAAALDVTIGVLVGEVDHPRQREYDAAVADWNRLDAAAKQAAAAATEARERLREIA
jgi:transcriptional regulator with XRE-family HTH domain